MANFSSIFAFYYFSDKAIHLKWKNEKWLNRKVLTVTIKFFFLNILMMTSIIYLNVIKIEELKTRIIFNCLFFVGKYKSFFLPHFVSRNCKWNRLSPKNGFITDWNKISKFSFNYTFASVFCSLSRLFRTGCLASLPWSLVWRSV